MHPDLASDLIALYATLETIRNAIRDADTYAARLVGWSDVANEPDRVRGFLGQADDAVQAALLAIAPHVARAMGEGRQDEGDGK